MNNEVKASEQDLSRYDLIRQIGKICEETLEQAYSEAFYEITTHGKYNHLFAINVGQSIEWKIDELLRGWVVSLPVTPERTKQ